MLPFPGLATVSAAASAAGSTPRVPVPPSLGDHCLTAPSSRVWAVLHLKSEHQPASLLFPRLGGGSRCFLCSLFSGCFSTSFCPFSLPMTVSVSPYIESPLCEIPIVVSVSYQTLTNTAPFIGLLGGSPSPPSDGTLHKAGAICLVHCYISSAWQGVGAHSILAKWVLSGAVFSAFLIP